MKDLFPKEILSSTTEVHQFMHGKKSQIIYSVILITLLVVICLLPVLKVSIYTSARGIVRPDKERFTLQVPNSGKITHVNLKNNTEVTKGDTLLVMDNAIILEKYNLAQQQIVDLSAFVEDLSYLLNTKNVKLTELQSGKYKKEYLLYKQKKLELRTRLNKLKIDKERSAKLFDKGVIARVEFEDTNFEYDLALSNFNQLNQQQFSTWQSSLTEFQNKLLELKSTSAQLEKNKSQFVITAPITGVLINTAAMEVGSYLNAGQTFVDISPNTNLLVECYISPQDIGLLKMDNEVHFQLDAFNYNQWGLATGRVTDIGKDVEIINNTSMFKVLCQLHNKELQLKNGFVGKLKKGMTLSAQFKLAKRSLFDLLYDKVDNWLNPSAKSFADTNQVTMTKL
ncbi:HlyD family secretion protein [Pseudotamlana carrageenivorans]|uniref:Secretion protein HlyD n=1 Tax=Pseudotamlana carrageenivorans TaxID=2069432 RepID=A0A2I7SGR5_9FLAO|nr:HlyD family efflux transporter periplasmic adaptor subunit [Tamlana carrageenivorans]AUS05097.1 secretion protein HlyD [Tamlana carrageenivorans]